MSTLRAYLQLVRLPAVFTAIADILLGYLLNHQQIDPSSLDLPMLILASSCLYLAGMLFNDVFDRKIDAAERPNRPLPSGRVSIFSAIRLGILLIMGGIGAATTVGPQSLMIALGLVVAIFAYDGLLKSTPLGPLAMGSCRFLNVMLGASAFDFPIAVWAPPQTYVALCLAGYIVGVTWFAREEARQSRRLHLVGATVVIHAALGVLTWLIATYPWPGGVEVFRPLAVLGVILFTIDRRIFTAIRTPNPANVQASVKMMLLSYIMICAATVYAKTGNPVYAASTALLLIPALFLGRWVFIT